MCPVERYAVIGNEISGILFMYLRDVFFPTLYGNKAILSHTIFINFVIIKKQALRSKKTPTIIIVSISMI